MSERLVESLIYSEVRQRNRRQKLYVVRCEDFYKIGIAQNVEGRVGLMQVGCPYELEALVVFECEDPELVEEVLHNRFGRYHVRGEWYQLPDDLVLNIEAEFYSAVEQVQEANRQERLDQLAMARRSRERKSKLTEYWIRDAERQAANVAAP